ncbi:MAG: PaaI family thioesterase [Anaerovoracaceae bacterium]|nr:PaaI family thioesterase [Bacillota bacterium]MDY5906441.1 PaaI family thioesterase [Anaerovoracaceae bacterium]
MNKEELREKLRAILSDRAAAGERPKGDIQVLEPEFVDYDDEGWLTVDFLPQDWQKNGINVVQGGILGYMLDCVFGPFAFIVSEKKLAGTIDTTTNFLRPVIADGRKIRVKARMITNAKRMMHAEGILYNADGKVAVTASTNLMKSV